MSEKTAILDVNGANCASCDSWKDRIRNAWRMLRGKPFVADEFVLEREEAGRMGRFLRELSGEQSNMPPVNYNGGSSYFTNKRRGA